MVYLDNNATTFLAPEVQECMQSFLQQPLANPSSQHLYGQKARVRLIEETKKVADLLGCEPQEICFTASATEAINLLLSPKILPRHVITSSLEHTATLQALARLEKRGVQVSYLDPHKGMGALLPEQIEGALLPETDLIVVMAANNETGIKSDINAIGQIAHKQNIPCIVDAVAYCGKEPFTIPKGVTGFVISGHKIHGPTGSALAVIKDSYQCEPQIVGGSQQYGRRGGTENLLAIVGLTKALGLCFETAFETEKHLIDLQSSFEQALANLDLFIVGQEQARVGSTSNIAFLGEGAETFLMHLDQAGIAASHGTACSSGSRELSHVLLHMGLEPEITRSSVRFSFSRYTTRQEVLQAANIISQLFQKDLCLSLRDEA